MEYLIDNAIEYSIDNAIEYSIDYLTDYPYNGDHLKVCVDLPCEITKGKDAYFFQRNGCFYEVKLQYWYVDFGNLFSNGHSMGFKTADRAVEWAVQRYAVYLKSELKRIGY